MDLRSAAGVMGEGGAINTISSLHRRGPNTCEEQVGTYVAFFEHALELIGDRSQGFPGAFRYACQRPKGCPEIKDFDIQP